MKMSTADICDKLREFAQVAEPRFRSYGGMTHCFGPIATIRLQEDNTDLIRCLEEPGHGRFLVVDVLGVYCAVVGERLGNLAHRNDWAGLLINGYVRDITETGTMPVGIWALGTCPRRSTHRAPGERGLAVEFAGIRFVPGHYLYADEDGIVVTDAAVEKPA